MREVFERREKSAHMRNNRNYQKLIDAGISEEIARLIAIDLAATRHNLHTNTDSAFNSESLFDGEACAETINAALNAINKLTNQNYRIPPHEEWTCDIDFFENYDDYDGEDAREYYYEKWCSEANEINCTIENAMYDMDKLYGTNIEPTRVHRGAN